MVTTSPGRSGNGVSEMVTDQNKKKGGYYNSKEAESSKHRAVGIPVLLLCKRPLSRSGMFCKSSLRHRTNVLDIA